MIACQLPVSNGANKKIHPLFPVFFSCYNEKDISEHGKKTLENALFMKLIIVK